MKVSPDAFLKAKTEATIEDVCKQLPATVKYSQWKRVEVEGKKMKLIEEELDKERFASMWKDGIKGFEDHAKRVKIQYGEMRHLKENLPASHAIVQMDFAENYTCQHVQEVQSFEEKKKILNSCVWPIEAIGPGRP